jgi:glycosyltransferase involved in cell wall biosynthesis
MEMSEGLVRRGHQVTVVTSNLEQPYSRKQLRIPPDYCDLAKVHRLPTFRIPRIGFPIPEGAGTVIRNSQPDIIHAHCALHSVAPIAWRAAKRLRVPFVLHTVFSPRHGLFWRGYFSILRAMIRDAAAVIVISEFERNLLIQAGLSQKRVVVLFPGVDLTTFETRKPPILARYGLEKQRVVVSLCRLAFGKRVDRLLQALPGILKRFPDTRLLIIGPDYGDEARLRKITSELKIEEFVTFSGALPEPEVAAALQEAAAFVMTSDFELFGITLIEAMAAGTVVIAPDVASVPNVVRNEATGLLYKYDDPEDLKTKLNRALGNENLRMALIEAAAQDVETRFAFATNLDRLEEIYTRAREEAHV